MFIYGSIVISPPVLLLPVLAGPLLLCRLQASYLPYKVMIHSLAHPAPAAFQASLSQQQMSWACHEHQVDPHMGWGQPDTMLSLVTLHSTRPSLPLYPNGKIIFATTISRPLQANCKVVSLQLDSLTIKEDCSLYGWVLKDI